MNDTDLKQITEHQHQITDITDQEALMEQNDAYQRMFKFLSQFDEQTRDLALADLNTIYEPTALAIKLMEEQQRTIRTLKNMLEDQRVQIYLMGKALDEARDTAADMRELGLAVAIGDYMGIDPQYATHLIDVLQGIEDNYSVDESILDDIRDLLQRIQADMQDCDMLDAFIDSEAS